jgi:RNA polymerase sigma factor (TIGR02999 family)
MTQITQLLHAMENSDPAAAEELLPLVYQELRRHASVRMAQEPLGQTLQATALVHEAWLRLMQGGGRHWQNRAHFFAAAAESMRRILIEQARRKSRIKRGGGLVHVDINEVEVASPAPNETLLQLDEALERLKALDPEKAQVVILKFYLGLSDEEAANCMELSVRTIARHWAYSKAWLFQNVRSA